MINNSIRLIWLSLLIMVPSLLLPLPNPGLPLKYPEQCVQSYATAIVFPLTAALLGVSVFLFSLGVAGFIPNILPFLIDQLSEASNSLVSSFVRWFAWALFVGFLGGYSSLIYMFYTSRSFKWVEVALVMFALHTAIVVANVFCRQLFTQSQGYENPYKTVIGVLNFAKKHKAPIRRSAMTYCENKLPGRIDLAKVKYGGPFTHEDVENVKTFFRILLIFVSLAGYYFAYSGPYINLFTFLTHLQRPKDAYDLDNVWQSIVILNDPIIPILAIPLIELVVHCLWPKFEYYLHKPFIWIALGYVALTVCNGCLTIIAAVSASDQPSNVSDINCFLNSETTLDYPRSTLLVEVPSFFFGVSDTLVFTSVLYFVGCQAPSNMRGMLLGLFLLAHGGLVALGNLISLVFSADIHYPLNCGFWYWLTLTVVGGMSIPIFILVAKNYKKRERQEIVDYRGMIESVIERDIQHDEDLEKQLAALSEERGLLAKDGNTLPRTTSFSINY